MQLAVPDVFERLRVLPARRDGAGPQRRADLGHHLRVVRVARIRLDAILSGQRDRAQGAEQQADGDRTKGSGIHRRRGIIGWLGFRLSGFSMRSLILGILLIAAPASAQTPAAAAVQPAPPPTPPPPTLEGKAELSFVSTGGNTDSQTLGSAAELIWRASVWKTEAKAAFVRAETDDRETARALFAQLRESRQLTPRLELFGRGGVLRDAFAGIDARFTLDAGLGWLAVDRAPHTLRLDGGLGYLAENRLAGEDVRSAIAQTVANYKWAFSKTSELTNDAAFLLPLGSGGDWRYRNTLALSAGLSRVLSLKVSHAMSYLNEPVPG